ncbi:hypothetical protein GO491_11815 [Flavobacteriaceae bacterium Ap0902]|nr:hypothetical protein [Flavobacteriaceae bacterium Ap0902]
MIEPLDINELNFKLHFKSDEDVIMPIDEPIGWEDIDLSIKQGDMYARVLEIGDDEFNLRFAPIPDHYNSPFDKLINYLNTFGYESKVDLIVSIGIDEWFRCELDFSKHTTNKETYFECPVIIKSARAEIERKNDIKVDLLSNLTLDDHLLYPIDVKEVTLKPKEIKDVSRHQLNETNEEEVIYSQLGQEGYQNRTTVWSFRIFGFNKYSTIDTALSYENGAFYNAGFTGLIQSGIARDNMGATHEIKEKGALQIRINFDYEIGNVRDFFRVSFGLYVIETDGDSFIVNENENNLIFDQDNFNNTSISRFTESGNIEYNLDLNITRLTKLAPIFTIYTRNNGNIDGSSFIRVSNVRFDAEMIDEYPATTAKMVRLIDAGKHVLSNYTNGEATFEHPKFDSRQTFHNLMTTTGFYIRGFDNEPMPLSYKDWLEQIQALNCDVQINGDNIFIGRQEEFYRDIEMARFEFMPDVDSFNVSFNEERMFNKLTLEFDKYEEGNEQNTLDSFTTETEWYVPNKRLKETKEIKFPFIADAYLIETTRREGIDVEPTTAKQEDNDFYIIDCRPIVGEFDENGVYTEFDEPKYTNRSREGFTEVRGLFSPETTYNLRLSPKRLLLDHWNYFLAEINQFTENLKLENSYFKNNGKLTTFAEMSSLTTSGIELTENGKVFSQHLKDPLISPFIYEFDLGKRVKFNEIKELYDKILNIRGYITFFDKNTEIKIYPKEINYVWKHEKLTITGELKANNLNTLKNDIFRA